MMQGAVWAVMLCGTACCAPATAREQIRVLDNFSTGGNMPFAGITLWHQVIFGTTDSGGTGHCLANLGCGTVFSISRAAGSHNWTPATLYDFQGGADDAYPAAPLSVDPAGNVYGYTASYTNGVVFRLVPGQAGYNFQILYSFAGHADGNLTYVAAPLILRGGHVYGIASGGIAAGCGQEGCGSLFRLDPPGQGGGTWTKRALHRFSGKEDGGIVRWIAGFDAGGGVYVATGLGDGAVARLAPAQGGWAAQVIARFRAPSATSPTNLVLSPAGALYGTVTKGRGGAAFSLVQSQPGAWTKTILAKVANQGYGPSSLALGPAGNLVGVIYGDQDFDFGNAFQLSPPGQGGGSWLYSVLWNFNRGPDQNPVNMVTGPGGNYVGVLSGGGYSNGSVFELRGP